MANTRLVDELDLRIRSAVYASFARDGRAPTAAATAAALGLDAREVEDAFRRLHDAHALVLEPGTTRDQDAQPLLGGRDAAPGAGRRTDWYANCAWDALGIPAALHQDGRIESACPDCGERLELEVRDGELVRGAELLVHFVVPARHWWDDITFT